MVRELLQKHRITRRQLAEALGVARVTVQYWQKGKRRPSKCALFALKLIELHGLDSVLSGDFANRQRKPLDCKQSKGSKAKAQ